MGWEMPGKKKDLEPGLLDGLLPEDQAQGYYKLSAAGPILKEQAAEFLGDARLVQELSRRGLARIVGATPSQPATFEAVPAVIALQTAIVQFQTQLLAGQKLLLAGHTRLADLKSRPEPQRGDVEPCHLVRVITDRKEIALVSGYLINSTDKDWMTLETAESDLPLTEDHSVDNPFGAEVRVRSIYDAATLSTPGALGNLLRGLENGDEVRILPCITTKAQIADYDSVLLPLTSTGTGGAVLFQGGGPVPRAMRKYFEMLWKMAVPYGESPQPPGCTLSQRQLAILKYLAEGYTDQRVSALVGCSKSTVDREMDKIEEITGFQGRRFALGVAVERLGWVPRDTESHG